MRDRIELKKIKGKYYRTERLADVSGYISLTSLEELIKDVRDRIEKGEILCDEENEPKCDYYSEPYDDSRYVGLFGLVLASDKEIAKFEKQKDEDEKNNIEWKRRQYEQLKKEFEANRG